MIRRFLKLVRLYGGFEIFYVFIMTIYMAQSTPETGRMIGLISGNPIPFLFPIILTFILCQKHPITFNNKYLYFTLIIYGIWAICSLIKYNIFNTKELSYHFFMVYAIIIAYIHNRIFGYKIFHIYEHILVLLCRISLIFWIIAILFPSANSFFRLFPETVYGNHIFYIFNWMDPAKGQIYNGILRNAGCSWEPGRFAIMITLAIYCNLCNNGIKFKQNINIWILLITLITTQSTTGYCTCLVLYCIFLIRRFNLKYITITILFILSTIYTIFQIDFIGNKITTKVKEAKDVSRLEENFAWQETIYKKGEHSYAIDRLDAMVFEWMNLKNDPILGYGRNTEHSYFYKNLSTNCSLANGLMVTFSMYGIILGFLFFLTLFISSKKAAHDSNYGRLLALFILLCFSAISYTILSIPIFTTFWFYGLFSPKIHKHYKL